MSERKDPGWVGGACLCGAVEFAIAPPTRVCAHCHCSLCRRHHGAGYVTWVVVPKQQFRLRAGEAQLRVYRSSDHGRRSFCGRCGSSLFFETESDVNRIDVTLASLTGSVDRQPQLHVYFDDRAEWVRVGDPLPRLGGETGMEPLDETR